MLNEFIIIIIICKTYFFFLIMQNILLLIRWYHQPRNTYAKCIKVTNPPTLYKCVCAYACACVLLSFVAQLVDISWYFIWKHTGSNYPFLTMPNEAICFILLWRNHFYWEKLHFITLNYIPYYTLHPTLFEYTFCALNYDSCYTLHLNIKFSINLDRNPICRVQSVIKNIV